jgi:hypothetical protein
VAAASEKTRRAEPKAEAPKCGATNKRNGKPCRMTRGFRTDHPGTGHCYLHGGNTPSGRKYAADEAVVASFGLLPTKPTTPEDAIKQMVDLASAQVDTVLALIRDVEAGDLLTASRVDQRLLVLHSSMEQLMRFAKVAKDAAVNDARVGLDERRVVLLEEEAEQLAEAFDRVFAALELTETQLQRAPEILRRELKVLEGGRAA